MKKYKLKHWVYIFFIIFFPIYATLTIGPKMVYYGHDISLYVKTSYKQKLFFSRAQNTPGKKILIVTFDLNDTGAPLMFLNLTKLLHQRGHNVFLLSYGNGRHEKDLIEEDIPYLISHELYDNSEDAEKLFSLFDIVISGRIPGVYFPSQEYKFIWWDHGLLDCVDWFNARDRKIYKYTTMRDLEFVLFEAKDIVHVSELQQKKLAECRDMPSEVIHNGIPPTGNDMYDPITMQMQKARVEGKTVFATVGYVDPIKGQDILIDAVNMLPDNYRKKAAFFIIGNDYNKGWADDLREKSKDMPEIFWTGPIIHEKIGGVYESADALLVPSREDTSPLVVMEAAEHSVPAVITDNVGSTFIVKNNESGFIIPVEDAEALAEKIKFFIDNPKITRRFGEKAHQNYEKNSSLDAFIANWEDKIDRKFKEVEKQK